MANYTLTAKNANSGDMGSASFTIPESSGTYRMEIATNRSLGTVATGLIATFTSQTSLSKTVTCNSVSSFAALSGSFTLSCAGTTQTFTLQNKIINSSAYTTLGSKTVTSGVEFKSAVLEAKTTTNGIMFQISAGGNVLPISHTASIANSTFTVYEAFGANFTRSSGTLLEEFGLQFKNSSGTTLASSLFITGTKLNPPYLGTVMYTPGDTECVVYVENPNPVPVTIYLDFQSDDYSYGDDLVDVDSYSESSEVRIRVTSSGIQEWELEAYCTASGYTDSDISRTTEEI